MGRVAERTGVFGRLLLRSQALRFAYTILCFLPVIPTTLLFSALGRMDLMLLVWRLYSAAIGLTHRFHGAPPPKDEPALWVCNHFNWFDWPMAQMAAPYQLYAIVKADVASESSLMGTVLLRWCRNLGAIFHTRGDRKSGTSVRAKIAAFPGAVLVFPEGTTQAYGPPMLDKVRSGSFEAAWDGGKIVQPVVLYYSARIGLGWEAEANGLRQTSLICARPTVAAVQLCAALRPRDFANPEALAAEAKRAMTEAYLSLEQRYQSWPQEKVA